jgi:hypothetical protein
MKHQFTTFMGEPVKPGQIVRVTLHGSAWPHVVTQAERGIKARPMARCGTHWDAERLVRPDDLWSEILEPELSWMELPQVSNSNQPGV